MQNIEIQYSTDDNSVNFIDSNPSSGFFESRYVRRGEEYFIVYLSIQSACNLGCKMCHLTATQQKKMIENTEHQLLEQARMVLSHYAGLVAAGHEKPAKHMHFNFMARGEVLNSNVFTDPELTNSVLTKLSTLANTVGLEAHFLLSTIMPQSYIDKDLVTGFTGIQPYFYYSIYSMDMRFRKKWLPMAMNPTDAINKLSVWNDFSENKFKIHYAFIKDQNDSAKDVSDICDFLLSYGLTPDVNIVRYNPYSEKFGTESDESTIERNVNIFREKLSSNVKVISRVGKDVKASCGMFIEQQKTAL